ncbi:MAG TPA: leucyl aminopeptidase [Homoserinimonas sp.]|nr:leucyl aminopeptidase [Homoserinimonas sp.]
MTVPALTVATQSPTTISTEVLVVGVLATDDGPRLATDLPELAPLVDQLAGMGVSGGKDELTRLPGVGAATSIALIGLGSGEASASTLRYAAGSAARQLVGVESIVIALPSSNEADVLAILEGAGIGAYSFTRYRHSSKEKTKVPATTITVYSATVVDDAIVERALAVAEATHQVRDLVNIPPLDLYPETFADAVIEYAVGHPVDVEVLAHEELTAGGFGGLLGVGSGSPRGPRLVKISYQPTGAAKHLALVGKGITFDTGGLSLKPPASMVGMKYDMTGAATVMAVVLAAARLSLPLRITGWLCLAENMPSGTAIRPNDVLRIRGGKTVEVLNTDAEGRLVLADGLVAAGEEHPDAIIDVATLTGAAVVALGNRYSAVMGEDELVGRVLSVATESGEPMWGMPLPEELRALLNTDVADIANAKIGSTAGGMLLAGVFLQEFIGTVSDDSTARIPWAHLDIAGSSNNGAGGYGFTGKGPTAVAVRTLLGVAEEISRA